MHTFVVGLIFRERGNFKIERKKERERKREGERVLCGENQRKKERKQEVRFVGFERVASSRIWRKLWKWQIPL
jgi:hypothetical protein